MTRRDTAPTTSHLFGTFGSRTSSSRSSWVPVLLGDAALGVRTASGTVAIGRGAWAHAEHNASGSSTRSRDLFIRDLQFGSVTGRSLESNVLWLGVRRQPSTVRSIFPIWSTRGEPF